MMALIMLSVVPQHTLATTDWDKILFNTDGDNSGGGPRYGSSLAVMPTAGGQDHQVFACYGGFISGKKIGDTADGIVQGITSSNIIKFTTPFGSTNGAYLGGGIAVDSSGTLYAPGVIQGTGSSIHDFGGSKTEPWFLSSSAGFIDRRSASTGARTASGTFYRPRPTTYTYWETRVWDPVIYNNQSQGTEYLLVTSQKQNDNAGQPFVPNVARYVTLTKYEITSTSGDLSLKWELPLLTTAADGGSGCLIYGYQLAVDPANGDIYVPFEYTGQGCTLSSPSQNEGTFTSTPGTVGHYQLGFSKWTADGEHVYTEVLQSSSHAYYASLALSSDADSDSFYVAGALQGSFFDGANAPSQTTGNLAAITKRYRVNGAKAWTKVIGTQTGILLNSMVVDPTDTYIFATGLVYSGSVVDGQSIPPEITDGYVGIVIAFRTSDGERVAPFTRFQTAVDQNNVIKIDTSGTHLYALGYQTGRVSGNGVFLHHTFACPAYKRCDSDAIFPCDAGKRCEGGVQTDCNIGQWCADGKNTSCLDGELCSDGFKLACPAGKQCISGIANNCPLNHWCVNATATQCTNGELCSNGFRSACPAGSWCVNNQQNDCVAGTYSRNISASSIDTCLPCPDDQYCPSPATTDPVDCTSCTTPAGQRTSIACNAAANAECAACRAGFYCPDPNADTELVCPAGSVCAASVSSPTLCTNGMPSWPFLLWKQCNCNTVHNLCTWPNL
jgi:hypothetical protein